MAWIGIVQPGHGDHVLERRRASRGLLAWTVVIEPSWPVFMAWSMSSASPPRTSPMMMRSGRMRRRVAHQVALGDLALALDVGRAGFQAHHVLRCSCSSAASSMVTTRSSAGIHLRQAVEQRGLARAGAAADQDVAAARTHGCEELGHLGGSEPSRMSCSSRRGIGAEPPDAQRRAVQGSGGMMALTRLPSARRASSMGDALVDAPADPARRCAG